MRRALSRVLDAPYHLRYGPTGVPAPPRPGASMLEVGPGAGDELAEHARRGWEVWAVEPSPAAAHAVAELAAMPQERMMVAAAEDAPLPRRRFDRVVMSHVIEHVSDPLSVVRRVRASMRPEAVLTVRCPNFASVERRLFGQWWSGLDVPRHLQHFTPRTLVRLLQECGLRTVNVRPQLEYASPSFSLGLALHDRLARQTPFTPSPGLYLACLPAVAFARMLGAAGMVEVEARAGCMPGGGAKEA
jgi:SAM-dependent methyltransferase